MKCQDLMLHNDRSVSFIPVLSEREKSNHTHYGKKRDTENAWTTAEYIATIH